MVESEYVLTNIPDHNFIGVYSIVNETNGKRYVGSSLKVRDRLIVHRDGMQSRKYCNSKILDDILKGHKFTVEVLEEMEQCTEARLRELEMHYSNLYDVFENGYNYNRCKPRPTSRANQNAEFVTIIIDRNLYKRINTAATRSHESTNDYILRIVAERLDKPWKQIQANKETP